MLTALAACAGMQKAASLPISSRFSTSAASASARDHKLVLFDVMDTLVADPFFRGFERDLFGLSSIKDLFAIKDQESFMAFERGEISEDQHFATYFTDRRAVDGEAVRAYMSARYEWLPGMAELCQELKVAGVAMAACSNYPSPWAPVVEDTVSLSRLVPWAFVSGEQGVRKPSPEAYAAALHLVGRDADDVICARRRWHHTPARGSKSTSCTRTLAFARSCARAPFHAACSTLTRSRVLLLPRHSRG